MKLIIQRVLSAKLTSGTPGNMELISQIGPGLMVLIGFTHTDKEYDSDQLVKKLLNLRLWGNDKDKKHGEKWKRSVMDMDYQLLVVSNFTLYHKMKGSKPDFHSAMSSQFAEPLYMDFLNKLELAYGKQCKVFPGAFGRYMNIEQVNDGPCTLVLESVNNPQLQKKYEQQEARKAAKDAKSKKNTTS